MSLNLTAYFRSLFLASFVSFIAPILLIGGAIAFLLLLGFVPGLGAIAQVSVTQVLAFLGAFGKGCALEGLMVIGFACSVVGALFDTYIYTLTTSKRQFQ